MQGFNNMSRMVEYFWSLSDNGGQCRPSMIGASRVPPGATSIRRSTMRLQIFVSKGSSKVQSERLDDCFGWRELCSSRVRRLSRKCGQLVEQIFTDQAGQVHQNELLAVSIRLYRRARSFLDAFKKLESVNVLLWGLESGSRIMAWSTVSVSWPRKLWSS
jgi:hypothetical protein